MILHHVAVFAFKMTLFFFFFALKLDFTLVEMLISRAGGSASALDSSTSQSQTPSHGDDGVKV